MRVILVAGNTEVARIDGISAAGADPDAMVHTPGADLEIVEYGRPVESPMAPVSPSGCPTPAVVTRAARELVGFETLAVDSGTAGPTAAPTLGVGETPGADIRDASSVCNASELFESARQLGRRLPDDELLIGETIPGGTTTALGVLTALGERATVSSSLPENPLALKREVVEEALTASGLARGDAAGGPVEAVRCVGDPVLATTAGLTLGAADSETSVTLAGGTQMAAAAALVRHAGEDAPLSLATTSFIADDETAALEELATALDLNLTVTDPEFERLDHPATNAYVAGEAKEGVGMGGALTLAHRAGVSMADLRERIVTVYERVLGETSVAQA